MKSSSNIRSIAVSYATYSTSGGRVKILTAAKLTGLNAPTAGKTVQGVAEFLAEKVDLTDSAIWIIDSDENTLGADIPPVIGFRNTSNVWSAPNWSASVPVSYDFALGVGGNDPTSTTPLVWTRGLTSDGTWGIDTPWKRGGHIAFLDGHVQFYNELDKDEDGTLSNPKTGDVTDDISLVVGSAVSANKEILKAVTGS